MKMVEKLRKFLERNKIFFEVLVATTLSFMAIFISIQANKIANKANEIAEHQTKIELLANAPQIYLSKSWSYNKTLKNPENMTLTDNQIYIENNGAQITNFTYEYYAFIKLYSYVNNCETFVDEIPVHGYYTDGFIRGKQSGTGLMTEISGEGNSLRLWEIEKIYKKKFGKEIKLESKDVIKLYYRDMLQRDYEDWYLVEMETKNCVLEGRYSIYQISKENGEPLLANWKNQSEDFYELNEMKIERRINAAHNR